MIFYPVAVQSISATLNKKYMSFRRKMEKELDLRTLHLQYQDDWPVPLTLMKKKTGDSGVIISVKYKIT